MIQETHFVSPITKEVLSKKRNSFIDKSGNIFKIIKGVPVLLPPEYMADWHRELIEVLLWEHPDEIAKIYKEKNGVPTLSEYISLTSTGFYTIKKALLKPLKAIVSRIQQNG